MGILFENKRNIFKILTILWMCVIFILSAQPASISIETSEVLVKVVTNTVINITGADVSEVQILQIVDQIQGTVRNFAHFFEYLILGFLAFMSFRIRRANIKKLISVMFIICFLYALSDEIHQLFVAGRAFQLENLALDGLGVVAGIGLSLAVTLIKLRKAEKN